MKKIAVLAAIAAFSAAPAFAASVTIKFESAEGAITATFDQSTMTYTADDGTSGPYTYDEAAHTICATEQDLCITFENPDETPTVGSTSSYTANNGSSGTATVTAMAE